MLKKCVLCLDKRYPPCTVIRVPIYNNKPKYYKFLNFLKKDVAEEKKYLGCNEACPGAIHLNKRGLFLNSKNCVGIGLCLINCPYNVLKFDSNFVVRLGTLPKAEVKKLQDRVSNFFQGELVNLPLKIINSKRYSLEDYTSINEVEHLSVWAGSILRFLSSRDSYLGLEIEILRAKDPRDGRLDICVRSEDNILVLESKVSLKKAVIENRFHTQIQAYKKATSKFIKRYNKEFQKNVKRHALLLIGGRESDLLPLGHPDNTGKIGGYSERFYKIIDREKIKFVSASALWCMMTYSVVRNRLYWESFFKKSLFKKNASGLLSGGLISKKGSKFILNPIPKRLIG